MLLISASVAAQERSSYLVKLRLDSDAEAATVAPASISTRMAAVSRDVALELDDGELEFAVESLAAEVLSDLPQQLDYSSVTPQFATGGVARSARAFSSDSDDEVAPAPVAAEIFTRAYQGFEVQLSPAEAAALANDPRVAEVHQALPLQLDAIQTPVASWGLDRIDQDSLPLNNVYEYNADGRGVHVYIIDTGIRASHQEFSGRIGRGYDFVDKDSTPNDCMGHGTSVASVLAGSDVGVAKSAEIHALKVMNCSGSADTTQVVKALEWVLKYGERPAVVNISMSAAQNWKPQDEAVAKTVNAGIPVVVSAGNGGADACGYSPAGASQAITVGSTDRGDRMLPSSNYGACVDIFAPGEGLRIASHSSDGAFMGGSGTSYAAPMVAGAIATLLEDSPNASPSAIQVKLKSLSRRGKLTRLRGSSPNLLLGLQESSAPIDVPAARDETTSRAECASRSSDPDGDGFGWENGRSCVVTGNSGASSGGSSSTDGRPTCSSGASDPDGDGFGWENGRTCAATAVSATGKPLCESASSDFDGDGFGWENGRSCVVQRNTASGGKPTCSAASSDPDGDGFGWENGMSCIAI